MFSWRYFEEIGHLYHALVLVMLGGFCGLCMAGDLFNLFVFLEILSVAAYALTAYKVEESGLVGALNFALTNTLGGVFILIAIGLVYSRTGVLDMTIAGTLMRSPDAIAATALALLLTGFLVKSAMAPFHFWLPDTYAAAPTPVAVLFGGVMLEVGLFAASRVYWLVFAPVFGTPAALRYLLVGFGAATAVLSSVMSLIQRDLKRLLAFCTIAHVALFTIGVGTLGVNGLVGAAIGVLSHGPLMGSLFLCAGIVRQRHKSVDEITLFGRVGDLPIVGFVLGFAAVALAGPPFSAMHAAESLIEDEARTLGFAWTPWLITSAG